MGRNALEAEQKRGPERKIVGLEIRWEDIEGHYEALGLAPQVPAIASRAAVPVYRKGKQVGKATSTTWSPTLKKMIALACVGSEHAAVGTPIEMELTVEAVRHRVSATVAPLPFFNPARKTATPAT